jgi:hypothetical protein
MNGMPIADTVASCSFAVTAAGASLGRKMANQVHAEKSASPCSCALATSGSTCARCRESTATAFTSWREAGAMAMVRPEQK